MTGPAGDPAALLRSRGYLILLVFAAVLGVPVSAAAYGFLALVDYLQKEIFVHWPHGLGYSTAPIWWPLPILLIGGVAVALAIKYLPGDGGPSPAHGFAVHEPPTPVQLPGVVLAAVATLSFGIVLGPEAPLIALGGGMGIAATRLLSASPLAKRGREKHGLPDQAVQIVASSGSFAAISALLGSPIVGAFLLMEASGLGGPMLGLVLVPGLLASGIGALIFIGLGHWTGLGTFSLAIPGLPHVGLPTVGEFGWALVIGLACALVGSGIRWAAPALQKFVTSQNIMIALPVAGLVVGGLAVAFAAGSGKSARLVLFSGQVAIGPLLIHSASYSALVLLAVIACKSIAYVVSLSSFRGGPIFPSLFIGAAIGLLISHLPGLDPVAGAAMGMGAMSVTMLTLPLTSVLLATLLLYSDGVRVMPLVIVAVVVAYVISARTAPKPTSAASPAGSAGSSPGTSTATANGSPA
ncbi:MAG TPA: chloride channel protein [Streptosporangiaceae bacterium]|nr:chloride channel protein [Streptosporangiaceae bacterium]